jgi:hypothetical protein
VLGLQTLLWGFVVVLLVLSCAARSPATQTDTLPPLGWSALVARLGVFGLKACVFAAPLVRRLALHAPHQAVTRLLIALATLVPFLLFARL